MTLRDHTQLIVSFVFASLLMLCFASTGICKEDNNEKANKDLVLKLWSANAGDALLENIKDSLITGEQNLLTGLEQKNTESVKKIVNDNFVDIKAHMLEYMTINGRSTQLKRAHNWLVTPMGEKVAKLKLLALDLFADPEAGIPVKEPELSPERVALQKRFEKLVFSNANTFQTATLEHFMTLQNQTRQPEQRWSDQTLDAQIKSASVKVSGITTQVLPHVFNRLYTDLSLEEVTVILNYLDSEAGRHYNDLLLDAYLDALKTTRPKALLQLSKLFEDTLSILSPYSKEKLTDAKQRELMALLIKEHGKATIIRAMIDARAGQITIKTADDTKEVYGRPNQDLVTLDTLMTDLGKSGMDIRRFYQVLQKQLRGGR